MMLVQGSLLLGASVCIFACCRVFLQRGLYNDIASACLDSVAQDSLPQTIAPPKSNPTRPWHSILAQFSFSFCFTECCLLFALLLCQGLSILDPYVRLYTWRLSLFLLFLTIIVLVPFSFCMVLTYRSDSVPNLLHVRAIALLLPVALFVFALSFIPIPAELVSFNPLSSTVTRLVVLGTIVLGLLSGLGSVNAAWGAFSRKTAVPSTSSISSAENALERVQSDLRDRTRDLDAYRASKSQKDGSWLSRMAFKRDTHQASLQHEIIGLQALESQMTTRAAALKRNREDSEFSSSLRGKILSKAWAAYCLCRVFSSVMNLLSPPTPIDDKASSYGDIIAHLFAYFFSLLPVATGKPSIDIPSLSRQISLALVGAIILSSVSVVLRGVTRAFRVTSRNISASLMLLLLAQLMGIYLLTTLVQLRTMFPPPSSNEDGGVINLFSSLPRYSLFGGLFDWSFLLGAVGCTVTRWAGKMFSGDDELFA